LVWFILAVYECVSEWVNVWQNVKRFGAIGRNINAVHLPFGSSKNGPFCQQTVSCYFTSIWLQNISWMRGVILWCFFVLYGAWKPLVTVSF